MQAIAIKRKALKTTTVVRKDCDLDSSEKKNQKERKENPNWSCPGTIKYNTHLHSIHTAMRNHPSSVGTDSFTKTYSIKS